MLKNRGFVALVGILVVILVIAFLWWRYDFSIKIETSTTKEVEQKVNSAPSGDTYIEYNLNALNKAKEAKSAIETTTEEHMSQ